MTLATYYAFSARARGQGQKTKSDYAYDPPATKNFMIAISFEDGVWIAHNGDLGLNLECDTLEELKQEAARCAPILLQENKLAKLGEPVVLVYDR